MASQTDITQKYILRVFRKHILYSKILLQRGHIVLQPTASLNLGAFCNIATLPHCHIASLHHCHLPCCQTGRKWQEPRRRAGEKRSAFQNQPLLGHKNHCSSNNLKLGMWRRQSGHAIGVLERPEPVGDPRCNRRKTNLRQIVKSRRVATVYKENANSRSW